jgi:quercetin dioxygenase-like cupin family protein
MPSWTHWQETVRYSSDGPGVTLLHQSGALKVVLVGLEPGQMLPPHPGPPASFTFLDGAGTMLIGDDEVAVTAGSVAVVPDGQIRSVRADSERLTFIGSLGDPASENPPAEAGAH